VGSIGLHFLSLHQPLPVVSKKCPPSMTRIFTPHFLRCPLPDRATLCRPGIAICGRTKPSTYSLLLAPLDSRISPRLFSNQPALSRPARSSPRVLFTLLTSSPVGPVFWPGKTRAGRFPAPPPFSPRRFFKPITRERVRSPSNIQRQSERATDASRALLSFTSFLPLPTFLPLHQMTFRRFPGLRGSR